MYNHDNFHYLQLITAHFSHYSWQHFWLNALALILLLYLFPATLKQRIFACLLAIVFIDGYLLLAGVSYYAGFSGLNYALIGLGCYGLLEKKKYLIVAAIILVLLAYTFSFSEKQHISATLTWHSLKQAHFLGFIAGLISTKTIAKRRSINSLFS